MRSRTLIASAKRPCLARSRANACSVSSRLLPLEKGDPPGPPDVPDEAGAAGLGDGESNALRCLLIATRTSCRLEVLGGGVFVSASFRPPLHQSINSTNKPTTPPMIAP